MERIKIEQLTFSYSGFKEVLSDINLNISEGETIGIIGENGAGKSTLLKLIIGLLSNYSGKIEIDGIEVKKSVLSDIRKKIGYVFQDSDSQLFMSNVYEDIAFAPHNYGYSEEETKKCVEKAMKMTNIENLRNRMIYQLSGGEKKLVSLAGILSTEPEIILFDEPSAALDPKNRRNLINILNSIKGIKLIASHDLDMIFDTCNRVILISKGKIIKDGDTKNILSDKELLEGNGLELPLSFSGK